MKQHKAQAVSVEFEILIEIKRSWGVKIEIYKRNFNSKKFNNKKPGNAQKQYASNRDYKYLNKIDKDVLMMNDLQSKSGKIPQKNRRILVNFFLRAGILISQKA